MGINLLLLGLVQGDEAVEDVIAGQGVIGAPFVIGEVILHWTDGQLLLEAIDLVEEEDDGGLDEPAGIADGVEQRQGFLHAVDRFVLEEELVVLGDGHQEENGGHVFEAMDPFLAF